MLSPRDTYVFSRQEQIVNSVLKCSSIPHSQKKGLGKIQINWETPLSR